MNEALQEENARLERFIYRGATVKAGTQERGTEVMWFHTGNYDAGSYNQR